MRSIRVLALVLPCLTLAACGDKDVTPIPTDDSDDEQLLPNLVVSSRALDFGVLDDVGDSAQTQIVVENTGVGDLELVVTLSAPFSATQSTVVLLPRRRCSSRCTTRRQSTARRWRRCSSPATTPTSPRSPWR